MRVDGELFLTPADPTGIEQLLTDETGEEVGRIIYDSFGGVVTSTIPVTLTTAFAGLPDAASGLVHMGGGRWFDPAIGRALQPNPTGGAPAAPQTMSRYAATPMGQPGVYAATGSRAGFSVDWAGAPLSTASNAAGAGATLVAEWGGGPFAVDLLDRLEALAWISVRVNSPQSGLRTTLKRLIQEESAGFSVARRLVTGRMSRWSGFVSHADGFDKLARQANERGASIAAVSFSSAAHGVKSGWGKGYQYLKVSDVVLGIGADLFIGGLVQAAQDRVDYPDLWVDNPDLARNRIYAGAAANATTGAIAAVSTGLLFTGLAVTEIFVAPVALVTVTGIAIAVVADISIGQYISEGWFNILDANINSTAYNNLIPLQVQNP